MSDKTQFYLEKIKNLYGDELEVLSDTIDINWYIKVRFKCGHEAELGTKYILRGKVKCSICNHKNKMTNEQFIELFNSRYSEDFEVKSEYLGYKKPIIIEHKACGKEFLAIPNNFLPKGMKLVCPYCRHTKGKFYDKFMMVEEFRRKELEY